MRVFLANSSQQKIGGGWSWVDNMRLSMPEEITDDYDKADVYLVPSASMVSRDEWGKAKDDGKKRVLRVDNALRNSRNRSTGMSRMREFARGADLVIYQSQWAKEYLSGYLDADGPVILNACDQDVFNTEGRQEGISQDYIYSRYNRDETKNYEMARHWFSTESSLIGKLYLVGRFSEELRQGNFDFYDGEQYEYLGVLDKRQMAKLYKASGYLLYSFFMDACSNTLIEALCCGLEPIDVYGMLQTGGAPEIMAHWGAHGTEYFALDRMASEYVMELNKL